MKKIQKYLFAIIALPLLLLGFTGCNDEIATYKIDVSVNDIRCCNANPSGAGEYKENQEVTLVIYPKKDAVFIGWSKNNEIVSTEATYKFKATKANEGLYKAIFKDGYSIFAKPTKFSVTTLSTVTKMHIKLSISEDINFLKEVISQEFEISLGEFTNEFTSNYLIDLSKINNYKLDVNLVQNSQNRTFENIGSFTNTTGLLEQKLIITQPISASNPNELYRFEFTFLLY